MAQTGGSNIRHPRAKPASPPLGVSWGNKLARGGALARPGQKQHPRDYGDAGGSGDDGDGDDARK